ncbi:uncharacterized protein N7469_006791 [Penicillium citrinum]|uniref:Quinate repressor protein n=1 Tax=Penicillium citrinum TaxID=5077 RepID=A0A9W9NV48_PENCI|nr:uncharacterized protein N7469_006791 [Penicillium citrinum]KAJ5226785.1 hypothetical protein N7469_006791 [Penicillium citrinum]
MSILVRPPKRKLYQVEHDESPRKDGPGVAPWGFRSQPSSRRSSEQCEPHSGGSNTPHATPRELNSNRASPVLFDNGPLQTPRKFINNASVVLIGIRGTGKSSLAVILAAASGRRLIDADRYFHQMVGCSRAIFKKDNEHAVYRQQEAKVFESMLADNQEGCVIACGAGSMERSGQRLLREYAQTHPVVHITRDPESIQSYLKAWDTQKVRHFLELSGPIYRGCSNLEFFNLSEATNAAAAVTHGEQEGGKDKEGHDPSPGPKLDQRLQSATPFLTLKRLQRDFLSFIAFITGDATETRRQHSSFPLSSLPVETRRYTSAISVPFSVLCEKELDIEELEFTIDAFELAVDVTRTPDHMGANSNLAEKISQIVALVRRKIIVPLVYHVESYTTPPGSSSPSPNSRSSDETYLNLTRHGLRLAPSFLTVDLSRDDHIINQIISAKGTTKIIGHFEAYQPLPGGWDGDEYMKVYERAKRLGCNVVRLCQPAESLEDDAALQRFRHRIESFPVSSLPLIAYNTGPLGRRSRCFNPTLTPVTHPSLIQESPTLLRPSITAREAQQALFSSFTLDPMQFFVFGANVEYSMSPAMHNTAFEACGMPHKYAIFQSSTLRGLNDLVENQFFGGSSVSLPYKTEVIPLLHSMSPHARAIGAVNTLVPIRNNDDMDSRLSRESSIYTEKGRAGPIKGIHGDNTDWIGICNCIRRGLSPANAVRPTTTGLVIGSGGMARAAVYSLIYLGVENIFVYNRTLANAEKLAHHYNRQELLFNEETRAGGRPRVSTLRSTSDPWPTEYKQPTIIVSGIPAHSIGGQPAPNFNVPTQWLESPTGGVVVDLAYKPLNTPLMKQIRSLSHRGWVALDGLDVLPEQGFAQFELFTGRRAPRRLMRTIVLQEYKNEEGHDDPSAIRERLQHLDGQPA